MNILLKVTYDGSAYFGYQIQPSLITVEGTLKKAIDKTLLTDTKLYSAARTDRGVHALSQYVNFKRDTAIDLKDLPKVINYHLPEDISVLSAKYVDDDFHSRFSAKGKRYKYIIHRNKNRNALLKDRVLQYDYDLDVELMRESLQYLLGRHDFKSFMGNNSSPKDTVRKIDHIELNDYGDYLEYEFIGSSFLKNMIRIVVGTTIEIGRSRYSPEYMEFILEQMDRRFAGPTVPGCGLYLMDIYYEENYADKKRKSDGPMYRI